ncbi:MAG: TerB family tellurite resistance protein [Pseudohongiellaceae bacterium]
MELFFIIVIGAVIFAWIHHLNNENEPTDSYSASGIKPLEFKAKLTENTLKNGEAFKQINMRVKGWLPHTKRTNLTSVVSLFVKHEQLDSLPIISALDDWQEPRSIVYQHKQEWGEMDSYVGFRSWVDVGVAIVPTLTPAWSGKQIVMCVLYLMDADIDDEIYHGYPVNKHAVVQSYFTFLTVEFSDHGYVESVERTNQIKPLAVKLAVAVAIANGSFDTSEGDIIKKWIIRQLTVVDDESVFKELKNNLNTALKEGYAAAKNGDLSISDVTNAINELADDADKYQIIELCMDIMAADGEADHSEMDLIWKIASSLGLDRAEVERIKDKKVVGVNMVTDVESSSVERILGIDPNWSTNEKKKFLRKEFSKWNSRLHSVNSPEEKENVQRMLDTISEARKELQ